MSSPTATEQETASVIDLEREYVLQNYARYPIILTRGKGPYVWDAAGKKYLDFISGIGVNALGHGHPAVVKAIADQAKKLIHSSNLYYHEYQGPLAQRLAQASGLQRVFYCNSGTESMEGALKMARSHGSHISPGKFEIVALENSFHGRTLGALSITGQHKYRKDFEPLLPGAKFVRANDITALEQVVTENTAAIVVEIIQGEGGIYPLSREFVKRARELADRFDALLIFDEIQCGVGRPGTYFSYQLFDPVILPDVAVMAKPISCGLPLGVILSNERAAKSIGPGMHGSTFGGNPIACRVALEFFDLLDELIPTIRETGVYFRTRLNELCRKFAFAKEVRGEGLMVGLELTEPGKQVVLDCMAEGLLINCTHDVVLRFLPPYIVGKREVDSALKTLTKVLRQQKW
ncbi:MAG TPA: aspartate aminotransferase family protein [Bryobacteraceae bacterium]|nr:aspartate aminotransferase family protein [Bryobacteraceae bacterium]